MRLTHKVIKVPVPGGAQACPSQPFLQGQHRSTAQGDVRRLGQALGGGAQALRGGVSLRLSPPPRWQDGSLTCVIRRHIPTVPSTCLLSANHCLTFS